MITLGASWVGSSAIPATAPIRPETNAWRLHPGDGTLCAFSTGASCGSRPWSSRVCSIIGGAAGITESACGARCAMTLDQLGAKMRCDKCGKRPERYYAANQSDTPGFVVHAHVGLLQPIYKRFPLGSDLCLKCC